MASPTLVLWLTTLAVLFSTTSADASAIERLQAEFPGAVVYDFLLTSGDGSALNAATCNAVERNTTNNVDGNEILINGQFPGPLVRVKKNQLLVVRVENQMPQATVTLHWHGIVQHGTPYADGAAMVSQCPLRPGGGEFIYVMNATDAGSFFYHGHIRATPLTLYGMLIVEDEERGVLPNWPTKLNNEVSMLLSDAWTKAPDQLVFGLKAQKLVWIGNPRVLLVNGRTRFPYTNAQAPTGCGHPVINVEPNTDTLWRIAGGTTLGFLSIAIEGHKFVILRSDIGLVKPFETKVLEVNSGQRYDVLVVKDSANYGDSSSRTEYWIHVRMMTRTNATQTWSVLSYDNDTSVLADVDPPTDYRSVVSEAVEVFGGMEQSLRPFPGIHKRIPIADVEYVFDTIQENVSVNEGPMQWQVNGFARSTPMKYPLLWYTNQMAEQMKQGESRESVIKWLHRAIPDQAKVPLVVEQGQVVQFVFQNRVATNKICEQHPFHLHFADFAVIGIGKGAYIPGSILLDSVPPVEETIWRDTVTMFASNHTIWDPAGVHGDACGWVAVRAKIETPGASLFHCHIASHMVMGMSVFLIALPAAGNNMPSPVSIPGFAPEATHLAVDCETYLHGVHDGIDS